MVTPIQTQRFMLKPLAATDASERYLTWINHHDTAKYLTHNGLSLSQLRDYIVANSQDNNCYFWGIFNHAEHIGNIKYQRMSNYHHVATLGILIGEQNWQGKGVAGEVINATLHYLKTHSDIEQVNLGVDSSNTAAVKAYRNIGFEVISDGYYSNFEDTALEMLISL